MNYFEFHIGDYAEATAHLSILEDGVYSRLLRKAYATERPLPAELDRVQRVIGARTEEERAAVEAVLYEFFELRDDGWHQERCDQAIAAYQAGAPERDIKKTNETVRQQRHRAERSNLFRALHEAGQFPAWNTPIGEVRALVAKLPTVPVTPPVTGAVTPVTPPVTEPVTACNALETATQYPVPSTHLPVPSSHPPIVVVESKKARQCRLPESFTPNEAGVAAADGLSLGVELEQFKNYHEAKGTLMIDWQAAWRTWCGNARKFSKSATFASGAKPASRHAGFNQIDYREGVTENGSFA